MNEQTTPPPLSPPPVTPPPTQPLRPEKPRRSPWVKLLIIAVIVGGSLAGLAILGTGAAIFGIGKAAANSKHPLEERPRFKERWTYGNGGDKIIHIRLEGPIMRERPTGNVLGGMQDPVNQVILQIRAAEADPEVKGIIFEVNSPGGAVTPSDEIYEQLRRFKEKHPTRHILVFVRDLAASGGYYASMASDWIIAEPTSVVGSIGVIIQSFNVKGLGDKHGVAVTTITSGDNKALLNPFDDPQPEHIEIFQELVDDMYNNFVSIVAIGRDLKEEDVRKLADGRVFTAKKAKEVNLIDEIGYWDDAVDKMAKLRKDKSVYVAQYYTPTPSLMEALLGAKTPTPTPTLDAALDKLDTPSIQYRWMPGF